MWHQITASTQHTQLACDLFTAQLLSVLAVLSDQGLHSPEQHSTCVQALLEAVPVLDLAHPEADVASVLHRAAVESGFFYGKLLHLC